MKQGNASFRGEPTSPYDIRDGSPANGLVWGLESFGNLCPPTDDNFYSRDGREFLRSSSWERKGSREKDRPKRWHTTLYEDVEYTESEEGEHDVFSWKTPVGSVTGRRHENHFGEYPVKSLEDLDAWIFVHSHMRFGQNISWFEHRDLRTVRTISLRWSPVQQLI